MLARILVAVALLATTAHAERRWKLEEVASWEDITDPKMIAPMKKTLPKGSQLSIETLRSMHSSVLMVLTATMPRESRAQLDEFEAGQRESLLKTAKERSYKRTEQPTYVQIDHILDLPDKFIVSRRFLGFDATNAVTVSAACFGLECTEVMQHFQLAEAWVPLAELPASAPARKLSPYELGYTIGRVVGIVLVAGFIVWLIRRRKAKQASQAL